MARVYIVGVRGIPNRYGGFERLVEVLGPHLASRGHEVTVFCEAGPPGAPGRPDDLYRGVRRRHVRRRLGGGLGTIEYDLRSYLCVERGAVALVFGYGTAIFQLLLRARGVRHAVNMDGFEWRRAKWSPAVKRWLRVNEGIAARAADVLVADHPEIQSYLLERHGRPSRLVAYGSGSSPREALEAAAAHPLLRRLEGAPFDVAIARAEPENQVEVLLEASRRSAARRTLVVVGDFDGTAHGRALRAAHPEAVFAGPLYDAAVLDALRARATLYLHGHSVGGTNPSLVEALGAGALVVAHDNAFNRWVAGPGALYFREATDLALVLDAPPVGAARERILAAARASCEERFGWPRILAAYEDVVRELAGGNEDDPRGHR